MSKVSEYKYYLNIHHRTIAININPDDGTMEQNFSPGHFYISLQRNEDRQFFGKYAQGKNLIKQIVGKEVIASREEEELTVALEQLTEQTGEEYHTYKTIALSQEQYDAALDYALSKIDGRIEPDNYILALDDCTDFVQQVYNRAGLPLYFTTAFSRTELLTMGSAAAHNVLIKYGAADCLDLTLSSVKALSKEALARSLNIDIDSIIPNSPDLDLDAPVLIKPSFRVLTDQINLPNIINNVEQDSSLLGSTNNVDYVIGEQDHIRVTEILPVLCNKIKVGNELTATEYYQGISLARDYFARKYFGSTDKGSKYNYEFVTGTGEVGQLANSVLKNN